jgi:hypothetical protein
LSAAFLLPFFNKGAYRTDFRHVAAPSVREQVVLDEASLGNFFCWIRKNFQSLERPAW